MYISQGPLPHLLPPLAYWHSDYYELDRQVLRKTWHLVGTREQLARPGDFLSCELLGQPIQVRNFRGELHALSNVCAHRHCLITSKKGGHSQSMRCQYHGWEYSSQGKPCKIPAPHNFVPFPKDSLQLPLYRVAQAGQLVFVCLDPDAPTLQEQLGDLFDICQQCFGCEWQPFLSWNPDYAANWKVPVENSLEAYHVPSVHPHTFGEDPGEIRSQHSLQPGGSAFSTRLPFAETRFDKHFQDWEGQVMNWLQVSRSDQYSQHHVFPNLLFSFTDAISFCQCLLPTGPKESRALVLQFGRRGGRPWQKALAWGWGQFKAHITSRIVHEDRALFASIQRGLEASGQAGILGKCEERIHAFQEFLTRAYAGSEGFSPPATKFV